MSKLLQRRPSDGKAFEQSLTTCVVVAAAISRRLAVVGWLRLVVDVVMPAMQLLQVLQARRARRMAERVGHLEVLKSACCQSTADDCPGHDLYSLASVLRCDNVEASNQNDRWLSRPVAAAAFCRAQGW